MTTNNENCIDIVSKHQLGILSEAESAAVSNKILQYYSFRSKKKNSCMFCKAPKSSNTNISVYNPKTACRTLQIKCNHSSNTCIGWTYTYGVVFSVYNMVHSIKQKIKANQLKTVMNQNNLLYGYTEYNTAVGIHEELLKERTMLDEAYIPKLYTFLYYTENAQLIHDIDKLNAEITAKIADIKQYTIQGNYKEVVNAYKHIKNTYKCIHKLKQYIKSVYTEQLIHCDDKMVHIEPDKIQESKPVVPEPVKKTKRTTKEKASPAQKPVPKKQPTNRVPDKIDNLLGSARDLLKNDKIFEIAKEDPDVVDDLDTYMDLLKKDIITGTSIQKDEYDQLVAQYNKFKNATSVSVTTPPTPVSISPKSEKIDNLLGSARDLLKDDRIFDIVKEDPDALSDLETYMNLLDSEISNGSSSQKTEYNQLKKQYETFKNLQSPTVSVSSSPDKIDNLLQSARDILKDDNMENIAKDDPEAVSDLETYMDLLEAQIANGSSSQKKEYTQLKTQYETFKNSDQMAAIKLGAIEL